MADGENPIFRTKSLERLSTPDRLDQLLRVVKRRNWIPLAGAAVILVVGLAWCFLGRIPITAEGTAVLVRPRQVVPLQAGAAGEVLTVAVDVGDVLAAGDVVATLAVPAIAKRIETEQARLAAFLARSKRLAGFNRDHAVKAQALLEAQRKRITARIATLSARSETEQSADRIGELRSELDRIRWKELETEKQLGEARIHDETSADEIGRRLARLEATLASQGRVVAARAGTVLEVTVAPGSVVTAGQRIASLAVDDTAEPLVALAYFEVADGKRLQAGMRARVAPVTVQKERYGSMRATVERVSAYPVTTAAVVNQVGNREMAQLLVGRGSRIEVSAALVLDPGSASGFGWTSAAGPDTHITAGTSARITVTIEERAPITLLIPALRGWLGLN